MSMKLAVVLIAAAIGLPDIAQAACSGREVTRTNPRTGITLTICLDGKYSTCIRDSMRFGNSADAAKAFCDGRKAAGAVK